MESKTPLDQVPMTEASLVLHGAPTLAGLKTASLFLCAYDSESGLHRRLRAMNEKLVGKGLCIVPLRCRQGRALVYVFRPDRLEADLRDSGAHRILRDRDYPTDRMQGCLTKLRHRLRDSGEFPHEIGLFLGYPPEDVAGFLERRPAKCVGCWKVYGDEEAACKRFQAYKACTRAYCRDYEQHHCLERLLVAVS